MGETKHKKISKSETGIILIPSYILLIYFLGIISCSNSSDNRNQTIDTIGVNIIGYDLTCPDETIILPPVLHEISGITVIDSSSVACVQDENGIVFIYDIQRKEIKKQLTFHGNGDYEGITLANDTIYVLRSDGVLFEITDLKSSVIAEKILLSKLSDIENEGLCYYRKSNMLLIAPKDKPKKESEDKDRRGIYGFDLNTRELIKKPGIIIDLSAINEFAADNKIIVQAKSGNKDKEGNPDIKFRPSAIGIHPVTDKFFVLSATDQMLFFFDLDGTIEYMVYLNPEIFNMPEGIAFFENGDMLISNEGQNMNATLLRFNYIK
ncbi:MAG: hypothetical protein NTW82_09910 [Bacteroidia bacterium]|nr:hypothetical protein [Bacteroidia bacterium]